MIRFVSLALLGVLAFFSLPSFGLSTAYVTMQEPNGWTCGLEKGVWICREPGADPKAAIFVTAMLESEVAKLGGNVDDRFIDYATQMVFNPERSPASGGGSTSKVKGRGKRKLHGKSWKKQARSNSSLSDLKIESYVTKTQQDGRNYRLVVWYAVPAKKAGGRKQKVDRSIRSLRVKNHLEFTDAMVARH